MLPNTEAAFTYTTVRLVEKCFRNRCLTIEAIDTWLDFNHCNYTNWRSAICSAFTNSSFTYSPAIRTFTPKLG